VDASSLLQSLSQLENLITRDAESFTNADERQREFDRRLERMRTLADCLGTLRTTFQSSILAGRQAKAL